MYESLGITALTAPQAAVVFALALGLIFGLLAERTAFCLRRALIGEDRTEAAAVWMTALAVALLGTQGAVQLGWIDFSGHRLLTGDLPIVAVTLGGLLFGAGMVLTRGCVGRLTVLTGTGNLRAALVIVVFAIVAHATLKGVLAPLRVAIGQHTLPLGASADIGALPGGPLVWSLLPAIVLLALALRAPARRGRLIGGALIGALVPLAWVGTGYVLYDDFDPITMESLSFTSPWTEALFWTVASSAVPAGFGTGLVGGVLVGALVSALTAGRFRWQSFVSPAQTGRYMLGAALMGVGGVLAGGCSIGAGLAGVPTLSLAALLALVAIILGAAITARVVDGRPASAGLRTV